MECNVTDPDAHDTAAHTLLHSARLLYVPADIQYVDLERYTSRPIGATKPVASKIDIHADASESFYGDGLTGLCHKAELLKAYP